MVTLAPGANSALNTANATFTLSAGVSDAWERAGVALLPVDEKRKPTGLPAFLFGAQSWNSWFESGQDVGCRLALSDLPPGTTRVLVIVYVYAARNPIRELRHLNLLVDTSISHNQSVQDMGDAAVIIAEFYKRDTQWKIRALTEGTAYGLKHFGRRLGIEIDDHHPRQAERDGCQGDDSQPCEFATGTGFAVSSTHILTCAHVIHGMNQLRIKSLDGSHVVEPVVVDEKNDLALLRVIGNQPLSPVVFKDGPSIDLGEPIITIGFPMAGLTGGGFQVTQGGVSSLTGLRSDASLLQFTAAIQPGSSGSPLFDMSGQVTGMVTSAVNQAQNMNFAVKSCLAISFLEAARLNPQRSQSQPVKQAHELVRAVQSSLWLIEARI